MTILGVLANVFLTAGLIVPYFEIWKRRGRVIGIDWVRVCFLCSISARLTPTDISLD